MAIANPPCPQGCWQAMAVIEVDDAGDELDTIMEDVSFDSWLDPQPASPGKRRYALMVNVRRGQDRTAMATHALLSAIAADGALSGFSIIAGEHWLQRSPSAREDCLPLLRLSA